MRPFIFPNGVQGLIHAGFLDQFRVSKDAVVNSVQSSTHVIFTGHSLGGAVASICSLYIKALFPNKRVECVTFGSPRVGNISFVEEFDRLVDHSDRIVNGNDPIGSIRSIFSLTRYKHVKGMIYISNSSTWTSWVPKLFGNPRDHTAMQYRLSLQNPSSIQWREMDYKKAFWGAMIALGLLLIVLYYFYYSRGKKPEGPNGSHVNVKQSTHR